TTSPAMKAPSQHPVSNNTQPNADTWRRRSKVLVLEGAFNCNHGMAMIGYHWIQYLMIG
ncbi:hypothetical protein Tco_1497895, partial [Tanacetum coccineum]